MAESNYLGLNKQGSNEFYDINVVNSNLQIIDDAFGCENLYFNFTDISALPLTFSNSRIKASHRIVDMVLSNPAAQKTDWTYTTQDGQITISGIIHGSTAIRICLANIYKAGAATGVKINSWASVSEISYASIPNSTTISTETDLFNLFDAKLSEIENYQTIKFNVSLSDAIPPFLSSARLMITLSRGASDIYAMALIQQAGANTMATAAKSTTWSMQRIATMDNVSSAIVTAATYATESDSIATQTALFDLFDAKVNAMANYQTIKFNLNISADISPFLNGARLMITLSRGAAAKYAMALIQQAGSNTMATAAKSTSWTMQPIITGKLSSLVGLLVTTLSSVAGGSKNYNVSNGTKMMVVAIGALGRMGMWIINTVSSGDNAGNITVREVSSHNDLSVVSNAKNSITFTNNYASTTPSLYAIVFNGSVSNT